MLVSEAHQVKCHSNLIISNIIDIVYAITLAHALKHLRKYIFSAACASNIHNFVLQISQPF